MLSWTESSEGVSYVGMWREGIPGKSRSKCKGPGARVSPMCSETLCTMGMGGSGSGAETGKKWSQKTIRGQTTLGPLYRCGFALRDMGAKECFRQREMI